MKIRLIFTLYLATFLFSCGGSSDDPGNSGTDDQPAPTFEVGVTSSEITDLNNTGNASDIRVTFTRSENEQFVTEYRAIIVKSGTSSDNFTLETANGLASERYTTIAKSVEGNPIVSFLSSTVADSDGEAIAPGQIYRVFILTIGNGDQAPENGLSNPSNPINLQNEDILDIFAELSLGASGMVVDDDGNVYCADYGTQIGTASGTDLVKITPEGVVSSITSSLDGPTGNVIGPDGDIYQANLNLGNVVKISLEAGSEGDISGVTAGINTPTGVAFDSKGTLYVASCSGNSVSKVSAGGVASVFASGEGLSCPYGIAFDDEDNLYIANFSNANLMKVDPQGNMSVFATIPGENSGYLRYYNNHLYVAARAANQILQIDMDGNVTAFAGSGGRGHSEGPVTGGTLSYPVDMAFTKDGSKMYINDLVSLSGNDPFVVIYEPSYLKRVRFKE